MKLTEQQMREILEQISTKYTLVSEEENGEMDSHGVIMCECIFYETSNPTRLFAFEYGYSSEEHFIEDDYDAFEVIPEQVTVTKYKPAEKE